LNWRRARYIACGLMVWQAGWVAPSISKATDLETQPEGTYLVVEGPISVFGCAPVPVDELPEGNYQLRAEGPGLPAIRGRFHRDDAGLHQRTWAGPGALLTPPGLTHLARGERRGWIFLGGAAVSVALAVSAESSVHDAQDDIDDTALEYSRGITEDDVAEARANLVLATQKRNDEEQIRNLWITYAGTTWVMAGLESWLLTPQPSLTPGSEANYLIGMTPAGSWDAGLRSLLVPGAGQRYVGHITRANLFATAVAVGAGASILAQDDFLRARRRQARAQDALDRAETESELDGARASLRSAASTVDDKASIRRTLVGVTAGLYAWNVLDALLGGAGQDARDAGSSSPLSWQVSPVRGGLLAAACWSLP
jgi:hypothetical protein